VSARVAIAGFGLAGEVFHAPLIDAVDGLEVSVVVTRDAERGARAVERYPGVRVMESAEEAFREADVAVIATPNRFHAPLALAALRRGLHVVVDKPFALSSAEASEVLSAAGGRLTVFQNRRWDGDFLTAARVVREGRLGEVTRFESRFERFRPAIKEGWRELASPEEGGGALLDLGPHLVDQAIVLFGRPRRVYAEVDARRLLAEVDDDVFIAIEHVSGVRSHLRLGAVSPLGGRSLVVSGLEGGFGTEGLDPQESQLKLGRGPGDPGFGERERDPGRFVGLDGVIDDVPLERGRYEEFYAGVAAWVAGEAPPPVDPADSLLGLQVLEAARRSATSHEVVELP